MSSLITLFKEYCRQHIRAKTVPLSESEQSAIMATLTSSPFRTVVQAWSVLDFYNYKHLWAEGFDTYFGYDNNFITAEHILEMVHPEDREAFGQLYYLCLEGLVHMPIPTKGIGHFCIAYRLRDAYGHYHRVLETNNIIACDQQTNIPLVNLAQMSLLRNAEGSGQVYYSFKIKDEQGSVAIMSEYLSRYDSKVNVFTEHELKIAALLKRGFTSQKIAETIFLSKHTIDKYRKHLLEKTQCLNTPQLIVYLSDLNLI